MPGTPKLTDKSIQPTDEVLYAQIGKNRKYWDKLTTILKETYPEVILEWKYYKDAKRWLLPVARKKKILFWLSFIDDTFMADFWFGPKIEPLFEASDLSEKLKTDFKNAERNKMGRGITIKVYSDSDLDEVLELINFKAKLK
jgi:hypothetical protein